ncbi:hypothetical protein HBO38_36810 [Pseudomonas veronii]|uniref:Uncharacterized protein n=1 Tax=Pseudomonas veronii TaxID=76761 RepID=A0A7Y1AE19_PSEVE|nr:hypothetical protein [Pseudomonas veronii]NMY13857.1 hypothetical protein [Pseudomonas veronii]
MSKKLTRICEIAGTVAGISGAFLLSLNVSYSPFGYVLFLISSILLAGHARLIKSSWLLTLQICFLCANTNGIYHWLILPYMGTGS